MSLPKKKARKGFTRSKKEWEKSIAGHIGKLVDKLTAKDLIDISLNVGLAYAGYQVFKDWKGALFGPISLKLAQVEGGTPPVAQSAGLAGLVTLGVALSAADWLTDPRQGLMPVIVGKEGPLRWNWAKNEWESIPEEEWGQAPY